MHRGTSAAVGYSDWWGQVGVIGDGGLLPVHSDSMTGKWGLCSQWSAHCSTVSVWDIYG